MIHLDTSFLVPALATGSAQDRRLRKWLAAGEPLATENPKDFRRFASGGLDLADE